jgi:hypothetical protein
LSSLEPLPMGKSRRHYCFGEFTLDLDSGLLRRGAKRSRSARNRSEIVRGPGLFNTASWKAGDQDRTDPIGLAGHGRHG